MDAGHVLSRAVQCGTNSAALTVVEIGECSLSKDVALVSMCVYIN